MKKEKLAFLVLGIYLIARGLLILIRGFSSLGVVVDILAIASGVFVLLAYGKRFKKQLGWLLAAIYLIAVGVISLISLSFTGLDIIMAVLALAAGVVLILTTKKITKHLGVLLFAIFLIAVGLLHFLTLGIDLGLVIAILAIAAGVLLLLDK
jgi:hypothetical protein